VGVCTLAADSMESSSKQVVSVDEVQVMNGDTNAGTVFHCLTNSVYLGIVSLFEYCYYKLFSGSLFVFDKYFSTNFGHIQDFCRSIIMRLANL